MKLEKTIKNGFFVNSLLLRNLFPSKYNYADRSMQLFHWKWKITSKMETTKCKWITNKTIVIIGKASPTIFEGCT